MIATMLARVIVPVVTPVALDAPSAIGFLAAVIVAAAVTARRPVFGLAAFIVLEPFDLSRALGPTTVSLPKALVIGFIIGLLVRRTSLAPLRAPVLREALLGVASIAIVTAATMLPATFFDPVIRETLKSLEYATLFAGAIVAYVADPDERTIWRALAASVTIVATLAIVQLFTIAPSGFALGNQVVPRIAGPLDGPNQLAGWFAFALPLLAACAIMSRSRAYAAVLLLGLVADALTYSRAGILGTTAGIACVAFAAFRERIPGLTRAAAMGVALPLAVAIIPLAAASSAASPRSAFMNIGAVSMRISGADEQRGETGLGGRDVLWRAALQMFARSPALGVGAGNFEMLTPSVGLVGVRTHANSLYLQSLAEGGLALLGAIVWTFAALLRLLGRELHATIVLGVAAGTVALLAHQLFDTIVFYPKVGDLWWLLLGIGCATVVLRTRPAAIA